jgi:hypothetical protein
MFSEHVLGAFITASGTQYPRRQHQDAIKRNQLIKGRIKYCRSNRGCTTDKSNTALYSTSTAFTSRQTPTVMCLQGHNDIMTFSWPTVVR